MVLLDMVQAYSFSSCFLVRYTFYIMLFIWQHHVWYLGLQHAATSGWWIYRHTFDLFSSCSYMATTSVCSLLQHRDADHDASVISCPSCSIKVIIFYAALCICQQRVFQVFFDIYLYLILNIVHMTASCLLPAYATYRNAQLMDSLLSHFSS